MSFGLLKHFKEQKKASEEVKQIPYTKHVIIGSDLGAVLKLVELGRNCPEESVRLISHRPINRQILTENCEHSVSQLRSSKAIESIYRKHFNAKILPDLQEPVFYKDGKFHDFGGRARPMELASGEIFFTNKGFHLEIQSLFSAEEWSNLDSIISNALDVRIFESIKKTNPNDLVEKNEWSLSFKDFTTLNCENLYLSTSPKKFLGLLDDKENLSSELIDLCSGVHIQSALSVTFKLNRDFQNARQTLFIPQSMTHEWGHFIVEFEDFDHINKSQHCHVLILIHAEEPQAEELAAKIKLMKRVLERVFPGLEAAIEKEFIRFDEEMFISEVKEEGLMQLNFDYPTLRFTGQIAPVASELASERFLARTLLT
jgi:hypothetical protein